ncbi:MAG: hypothetical protein EXS17_01895 [Phycisphaerales bacterium]|nr:hypothetical protein [Phycisphaerales bacterium]
MTDLPTNPISDGDDRYSQNDSAQPTQGVGAPLTADQVADGMAVHGLLALRQPGESDRIKARVQRAISTIREMNDSRRLFWRKRLAWVGGSVGIAAAIGLAVLYVPAGSDSSAYAALESIRGTARQGGRSYAVRFEMDGLGGPPPAVQHRDNEMKPIRAAELAVGNGGRWTLLVSPPNMPRARGAFGWDGSSYWAVDPVGSVRTSATLKELRVPPFISVLESGTADAEEDLELLTLDSMLSKLDKQYKVSFDRDSDRVDRNGRPVTVVTAERRGKRDFRSPHTVRIVADSSTFEVLRANWQWSQTPLPAGDHSAPAGNHRMKRIFLELTDTPPHGDEWFTPEFHARALTEMSRSGGPPRLGSGGNAKQGRD